MIIGIYCLIICVFFIFLYRKINDKFESNTFFDNNVKVYLINLPKHNIRKDFMTNQFNKQNIQFEIIIAPDIDEQPYKRYIKEWPRMKESKYKGTKGLYISNIIAMKEGLEQEKKWILIFEDDVVIKENFKKIVTDLINKNKEIKIFNLDNVLHRDKISMFLLHNFMKTTSHTGTVIYDREVLPLLITELDYRTSSLIKQSPYTPIFDNFLHYVIFKNRIPIKFKRINKKDFFSSSIATSRNTGKIKSSTYI